MDLYLRVAKELGVPLAPFDDGKKAFLFQTSGTILGIHFDTTKMTWTLPLPKLNEYRYAISTAAAGNSVTEKELQSINGYLNVIVTHAPILKCWRAEIITEMERAKLSPEF